MDKPRLSVVETEAVSVEHTVVRAWTEMAPFARASARAGSFETPRERERRFQELLEALPAAIYTTDANGKSLISNKHHGRFGPALTGSKRQILPYKINELKSI